MVKTECAECSTTVRVNTDTGVATARVPSNGVRGRGHVPAHDASTQGSYDGTLILWECPVCGYADSTYADPATRKELT